MVAWLLPRPTATAHTGVRARGGRFYKLATSALLADPSRVRFAPLRINLAGS